MARYEEIHNEPANKQYSLRVTSAAGLIGSNLVKALIALNNCVKGQDNVETRYQQGSAFSRL